MTRDLKSNFEEMSVVAGEQPPNRMHAARQNRDALLKDKQELE